MCTILFYTAFMVLRFIHIITQSKLKHKKYIENSLHEELRGSNKMKLYPDDDQVK